MKQIGKLICISGSRASILYPPYKVFGELNWGFLFGKIIKVRGIGSAVIIFDNIDYQTLLIELVIINIIGLVLIYAISKKKKRKRR